MVLITDSVKITLWIGTGLFAIQALVFGVWLLLARSSHKNNRLGNLVCVAFLMGLGLMVSQMIEIFNQGTVVRSDGVEVEVARHFTNILVSGLGALLVSALFLNAKKYTQWTLVLVLLASGSQLSRYLAVRTPNPDTSARWLYWSISVLLGAIFTFCATMYSRRSPSLRLTFAGMQLVAGLITAIVFVLGTSQTRVFTTLQPEAITFLGVDFFTRFLFSFLVIINYQRPSGSILPGTRRRTQTMKKQFAALYHKIMGGNSNEDSGSDREEAEERGRAEDTDDSSSEEEDEQPVEREVHRRRHSSHHSKNKKQHQQQQEQPPQQPPQSGTGLVVAYQSLETNGPTLSQVAYQRQ